MKTYTIWIEVEKHDDETDQYDNAGGLAVCKVKDSGKARDIMFELYKIGQEKWPE